MDVERGVEENEYHIKSPPRQFQMLKTSVMATFIFVIIKVRW